MLYRLVRPVKRPDSSVPQFVQRIPTDILPLVAGRALSLPLGTETVLVRVTPKMRSIRFSLRTRDPAEVKARQGQVASALERHWTALRNGAPTSLNHRQATALAGNLYRSWADAGADRTLAVQHMPDGSWARVRATPEEEAAGFASAREKLELALESGDPSALQTPLGPLIDRLLRDHGIGSVDDDTRLLLLETFGLALRDAFASRERNAEGDYSPDPKAARFPEFEPPARTNRPADAAPPKTTLSGLVADWWAERKAAGTKLGTFERYRQAVANLSAFLKHDDADRVTVEDVIRFKDHRLASISPRTGKTLSAQTVKSGDLNGLKVIFGWAVANKRLASNPAKDVTLKLGKPQKLRGKGFTDEEASAILRAALDYKPPRGEGALAAAAKRWVPWLCAYSGARLGEMCQLRKRDIRQHGPHWVVTITPDAGTVKTNQAREVVLHPHLIELGFLEFVQKAPAGHLFVKEAADGTIWKSLGSLKSRMALTVRATITDANVAPNHGWRHRFKTIGREAGIDWRVLDAIQGHAPRTEGEGYGEVSIKALADAMAKFPRIDVR
ncbi:recombinase XerD [Methylobacterium terrae]|uniref:Recombinase XerD n=1 Tax=Methylobacterium terrae TaxID=2202827 RepID=A0A2U8WTT5_9HYPH|nr:tyrosine-type recombinase/integrase [Methylobacterium terrae]AWN49517.1 recombinase XerD [Methylobacterium terrae]